ncbi:MAG: FAD-dependent oxidoreductase [Candidatus Hatepunaea meridiana]|nr:FAD-dependent oxidoreductase [Candidatus Hatepunaea meridiana]
MKAFDVLIIGGGPAGVQTAITAKNLNPGISVGLIRKEATVMIPNGIAGVINPSAYPNGHPVTEVLLESKKIELIEGEVVWCNDRSLVLADGRKIRFSKLVLATGSRPNLLSIPGIEKEGIYAVENSYKSLTQLVNAARKCTRILIVGGGYAGVELANEFINLGKKVIVVESRSNLFATSMDPEFGKAVERELERRGCQVKTGTTIETFEGEEAICGVKLSDGSYLEVDLAIITIGFRPEVSIAESLGLALDKKYGIIVDEYMRTSKKNVFAAGDCATTRNSHTGGYTHFLMPSAAMVQGRIAGANLFKIKLLTDFPGTLGTFTTKIGDIAIGVVGLNEKQAEEMDMDYLASTSESSSQNPEDLRSVSKPFVKLIFSRHCHTLLGAQIIGGESVGEVTNMLSVMIQKKMTDMEIDTIQIGTHPLLTPSPISYPVINATVNAILKWYN